MRNYMLWLGGAMVTLLGCAGATPDGKTASKADSLTVATMSDSELSGSFEHAGDALQFRAHTLSDKVTEITLNFHGLTLDALRDDANSTIHLDGFAKNGSDTAMVDEDRKMVLAFTKALETKIPDITKKAGVAAPLDNTLNLWAQWVPEMSLKRTKFEDAEHLTMLCSAAQDACGSYTGGVCGWNWYEDGHDCWTCNADFVEGQIPGDGNCKSQVQLGDHYQTNGCTMFYNNGWYCNPPSHGSETYETGDCFGRYGADCGSGHGYNLESLSHDHCVRNGHVVTSSWCSDELFKTGNGYDCY
ncbi:MAG: hypothetical protein NVSMB47_00540 [Polyangiales bacterium]